jgi:hypothetical protein
MSRIPTLRSQAIAFAFVLTLAAGVGCSANAQMGGGGGDKRKSTTIQSAKSGDVEVRYLNLPWGEKTFSYIEVGGNEFYSTRPWPFAHLKLAKAATWEGKQLAAGDYVLYITPKSASAPMTLTVASFTPGPDGTFLQAGNVFTEVPKDVTVIATVPAAFEKKAPVADELQIAVDKTGNAAELKVHYGDRWLTQRVTLN